MSSLEERIARLESRAELQELLVRYTLLIDDHDFDALGELFTADARFGRVGSAHVGRDAIVANYRAKGDQYPISLHVARGAVFEFIDDDLVRGQVLGFSEQASADTSVITAFRYDDEYRREDGRWRFAVRDVRTLYALTHAEFAAGGLSWDERNRWPHHPPTTADLPPR